MAKPDDNKIKLHPINAPDHIARVDGTRDQTLRAARLAALRDGHAGMIAAEAKAGRLPHVSPDLFPGGQRTPSAG